MLHYLDYMEDGLHVRHTVQYVSIVADPQGRPQRFKLDALCGESTMERVLNFFVSNETRNCPNCERASEKL